MEYYPKINKVEYKGKESKDPFSFRFYDKDRMVLGKKMSEHLPFAVAYWHTMVDEGVDPFGQPIHQRDWKHPDPMIEAENKVEAIFEILSKLGVEYFCFHDIDIAPEGDSLEEFFANIDYITDLIKNKMDETGIKLLWNTANMFSNPRYVNGAGTSPNADVYAIAAAQVKKGLDISKKLSGENYVFWGGREGYDTLINTDMKFELENIARLFKMADAYATKIEHKPQFLIEPKPKEPTKHQYDFDAATSIAFLQNHDLMNMFKLNLEGNHATLAGHTFEHEIRVASDYGVLGSIDANQGDLLLGWDVDEFPTNVFDTTLAVYEIIKNGGLGRGGINFDSKVRRSSFSMEDLLLAHIAGMDTYARALLSVEKLIEDKFFENIISERYESYTSGIGKSILSGEETLETLSDYALSLDTVENKSSHIEYIKSLINDYLV